MIKRITKAYVRKYTDNGQTVAYIEFKDHRGQPGRIEGRPTSIHMKALLARAKREGVKVSKEVW